MDQKTSGTLLTIASLALAIGGLILLLISIFSNTIDNWTLSIALMAIILSNLLLLIRPQRKSETEKKNCAEKKFEEGVHE